MPQKILPYQWFSSILRGESPLFSDLDRDVSEETLWQVGLVNGVLVLSNHKLASSETIASLPQTYRDRLHNYCLNAAATELGQEHELRIVLTLFTDAGIPYLLMKGTPLAYTYYPQPYLRSRCDTDILFENRDDAEKASRLLQTRGYQRPNAVSGEFVSNEFCCYRTDKIGVNHTLDMHWKLNNIQFFARPFSFKELTESSISVTPLNQDTLALGPVHALLLACMHRIGHKLEEMENRLIWLYDIHLLAENFDESQWQQFVSMAEENGMCGICLDGIQQTVMTLGTNVPEKTISKLAEGKRTENFSVETCESRLSMEMSNLRTLLGWRDRMGLIKERLFPDTNYMMVKYDTQNKVLLPYLYLKRAIAGLFKIL